jgi:hypothetical protein
VSSLTIRAEWTTVLLALNTDVLHFWQDKFLESDKVQDTIAKQKLLKTTWEVYCSGLPPNCLVPTFSQICYSEEGQTILQHLEAQSFNTSHLQIMTKKLSHIHHALIYEGTRLLKLALPASLSASLRSVASGLDTPLCDLATTIFRCMFCESSMHARQALLHVCCTDRLIIRHPCQLGSPGELHAHWIEFGTVPLKLASTIHFNGAASHCAQMIVQKAFPRRPSNSVSCQEMDACTVKFVCVRCQRHRKDATRMTWRNAVSGNL